MPKRIGYLYETMCDRDLIRRTILQGTRGKRKRRDVQRVLADVEGYTEKMYWMLVRVAFVPSTPRERIIHDSGSGKERIIQSVPYFPDGLVHQLAVAAMQEALTRGMYKWSCASIPGRGPHYAGRYVRRALDKDKRGTKYCLKMDISKYYQNIDRNRLMAALERKIKDRRFLELIRSILDSSSRPGIAIGFYINQWLANFYLEPLDRLILTQKGVKFYVRHMDDMVIFGPNKKDLRKLRQKISHFLEWELGLQLKGDWQVFPVSARPVDFVGYRFYRDHTTLRRRNYLRLRRRCMRARRKLEANTPVPSHMAAGVLSRLGQLKHCDGHKTKRDLITPKEERALKKAARKRPPMNAGRPLCPAT